MKNINLIILILMVFYTTSCGSKKVPPSYTISTESVNKSDTLSHLKYRIPDCDSALVFMDQMIVPVKSLTGLSYPNLKERDVLVKIPGETFRNSKNEKHKFYLNIDCLVGLPVDEVYKLFCPPESIEDFVTINKAFQEKEMFWLLVVRGVGPNFSIGIKDGKVVNSSFFITTTE